MELALEIKFGKDGLKILNKIKKIEDIEKLVYLKDVIKTASKVSEIDDVL